MYGKSSTSFKWYNKTIISFCNEMRLWLFQKHAYIRYSMFFCIQKSDDRFFIKICQYILWRGVIKKNLWPDSCRSRLRFTEHLPHGGIETLFFDRSAAICAHSKSQGRQAWLRLYGISVLCSENKKLMAPQKMTKAEAKKLLGIKNGNYMKPLVKKCAKCAKMQRNCCILAHSPLYWPRASGSLDLLS